MHMDRQSSLPPPRHNLLQLLQRDRPNTVRSNPNRHLRISGIRRQQCLGVRHKRVRRLEEPRLPHIRRHLEPRPQIRRAQQHNSHPHRPRRRNYLPAELVWVVISPSIRSRMHIMKLSHHRRPRLHHLQERHPRDIESVLRRQLRGSVIHRSPPRPEVPSTHRPRLRSTAYQPLKAVRVHIHKPRQHCPSSKFNQFLSSIPGLTIDLRSCHPSAQREDLLLGFIHSRRESAGGVYLQLLPGQKGTIAIGQLRFDHETHAFTPPIHVSRTAFAPIV